MARRRRKQQDEVQTSEPVAKSEMNVMMRHLMAIDIVRALATHVLATSTNPDGRALLWNFIKLEWSPPMGQGTTVTAFARLEPQSAISRIVLDITFHPQDNEMVTLIGFYQRYTGPQRAVSFFAKRDEDGSIKLIDPKASGAAA